MSYKQKIVAILSLVIVSGLVFLISKNLPVKAGDPIADSISTKQTEVKKNEIAKRYGKLPISFEANKGQTDDRVKYVANGTNYSMFLTNTGAVLSLKGGDENARKAATVGMKLIAANEEPKFYGQSETEHKTHYFIGRDPAGWQTDISNFEKVKFEKVYEGVDLVYYGNQSRLEYDFVVSPGADPGQIRLNFEGLKGARVEDATGDLILDTEVGEIRQHKPFSYQMINGEKKEIASLYDVRPNKSAKNSENEYLVKFNLAEYDKSKELVIDPILVYGSYLGGGAHDSGSGITIDAQGNAYIIGSGLSRDFPTTAGVIKPELLPREGTTNSFWSDAFVTKINPTGSAVIFSTYIGGRNAGETGGDIEVDDQGNVYINGTTQSSDFPLVNPYRSSIAGPEEAFAVKLNPTGSAIIYSTFIGGNNSDSGTKIALNKSTGEATYLGRTSSPDFSTTTGALKERLCTNPQDCSGIFYSGSFVARFAADGTAQFVTLFDARLNDIALDQNSNSVIVGSQVTPSHITSDAYQSTSTGGGEGFFGKLNAAGSQILYGSYLGGGLESDAITALAVDNSQNIYLTGQTENAGFPVTPGAFDTTFNGSGAIADGFITKFDPTGTGLIYSTFIGGSGRDEPKAIGLGSDGSVFVAGETTGASSFPLRNSITNTGTMFLTHLNTDASAIVFSTLLGPIQNQGNIYSLAVDATDNAYVTGKARSIPVTPGAFQTMVGGIAAFGANDAFVLKLGPTDENATFYSISGSVANENQGTLVPVTVTISGSVNRSLSITGGPYHFGSLPAGGDYTVSVSAEGFEVSPESIEFNNLGANQFANFTILRNQKPISVISTPEHHTNFDAPASIHIEATASDPDVRDTISKIEFVAFKDGVSVPIGIDTAAPYEADWENVTDTGTWAIYAFPYDNHGLKGDSSPTVHVFVNDPAPVSVSFVRPAEGAEFVLNTTVQLEVAVSSSVSIVEVRDETGELVAFRNQSPWVMNWWADELGTKTLTATAYNSEGESANSKPRTVTVLPINHRISGTIYHDITNDPVPDVTLNLTGPNGISAQTTTDTNGNYTFTDLGASSDDTVTITPTLEGFTFDPENIGIWLAFLQHHQFKNFLATPITGIEVNLTSPGSAQQFPAGSSMTLAADATSESNSISKVEFYVTKQGNTVLTVEDLEAPYSFNWTNPPSGVLHIFARAYDDVGGIADSGSINVFVNESPDVVRLQGAVTNANGGWMPGITLRLTGTANGNTIDQTSVSNNFGSYGFFNLPLGGDYTITPQGTGGTTFTPQLFSVENASADNYDIDFQASTSNQSPTVVINNPTDGAVFTMPVTIPMQAVATDADGKVIHFQLQAEGNGRLISIGEVNNGNYDIPWEPSAPGVYTIYATARDNGGLRTTETISITVNAPAPVTISGRIVDRNSNGIPLVTVTMENTSDNSVSDVEVFTDSNGNYTVPNVTTFNNYRVKPTKLNHTFTPSYRNYFAVSTNQSDGDHTGTLALQPSDFDGDGMSDIAVWRPADGIWHIMRSNDDSYNTEQLGDEKLGDILVPGNYDGDDRMDVAIYRKGSWHILYSTTNEVRILPLGRDGDRPVPGDFDGDGITDIAVWRPETGVWYILRSSDLSYDIRKFGTEGDIPLVGDYDGDGKAELAVWRPTTGEWYVLRSTDGDFRAAKFGIEGDVPLVGDFDGDGLADYTIYRPDTGYWYVFRSLDANVTILKLGIETDIPVPGDFDRDGKTDFAVFRESDGYWYIYRSATDSYLFQKFGIEGDIPIPAAFQ